MGKMGNAEPTREMPNSPRPAAPPAETTQRVAPPVGGRAPLASDVDMIEAAFVADRPPVPLFTTHDPIATDAAKRAKLEAELSKMGLSPQEVRRLLDADPNAALTPAPLPTVSRQTAVVLAPAAMAVPAASRPRKTLPAPPAFPEFRESSPAELREAEPLLREASLLRRRDKYTEAEAKCRAALELVPNDAAALELLGDIWQGLAKVDDALAAYQRAVQADAKRTSAERKYADLLTRQQDWSHFDPEAATKNPWIATLLSGLCPGTGQFYNGDVTKAVFFFLCDIVFVYLIAWSPWGFKSGHRGGGVSGSLMLLSALSGILYIASLMDAMLAAKRGGSAGRNGWEL